MVVLQVVLNLGTNAGKIYSSVQGVTKSGVNINSGVIDIYRENSNTLKKNSIGINIPTVKHNYKFLQNSSRQLRCKTRPNSYTVATLPAAVLNDEPLLMPQVMQCLQVVVH
jgi:hypothetical protein